jgi:6-phosphogluconolactonase (cycloisomerase 2 family)
MMNFWLTMTKFCFASTALLTIGFAGTAAADNGSDNGAVYTMTNDPNGNAVVVYARAADGTLTMSGMSPTGGTSIGVFATGNQRGLLLSNDGRCLWAVNSLSNQISAFKVKGTSLSLPNVVASGGQRPISVAVNEDLGVLYVLNAGGQVGSSDNVTGFTVGKDCGLSPLAGSTRALSGSNVSPAQVSFNPTGSVVVVTEKTNDGGGRGGHITSFTVGHTGLLGSPKSVVPPITEPFGFAFDNRGRLLVTAADCTKPAPPGVFPTCSVPPDSPSLLSYTVAPDGTLTLVDTLVGDQAAICWIAIAYPQPDEEQSQRHRHGLKEFAFTSNNLATQTRGTPGSPPGGSITRYDVRPDGTLTELGVTPVPLQPNGLPIEDAVSRDSRFLYVLGEADGTITAYRVEPDGLLAILTTYPVTTASPFPNGPFPNGLAAR